ncbi:MAG: hypothetical protein CMH91_07395 [Oceanicaulis sp.]|uniref:DUF819 family protein n=1 Tax=unclassified Oceanicaulis TaxID=2632123 RepID=UPI000C69D458|nr:MULTISPECIES: DUF819 family protein [unclassified Oceanicaulis]MAB69089.1 hypothetical protein [Oceanicaulis sp.]MBC38872.1 hypothetical protein [Oceanicaulis sp.]MBG35925.1 hypothetical protein [Oceanicaulis sp.]HBU63180.1 hypothetical protein [Oceanicaulis sp.]|tara:strand:- start:6 stop:1145 length:1140 start_codon:yes stop_codon:yes gene_type:complete
MDASLIPADNNLAVMAGLTAIAAAGFLLEKTKFGALLTGTVWTILLAILASNLRLLPFDAPAYGFVFTYAVPVLIPLFLMKADLKRIFFETTRMTGAFLIAAFATLVGALVAAFVLPLGEHEVGIASSLTASYVGGSVNFAALTDVTGLAETAPGIVSAMLAADNMASAAYLGVLAILPGFAFIAKRFVKRDHTAGEVEESGEASEGRATPLSLGLTLAYALIVVAVGDFLTRLSGQPQLRYVIITVLALVLPTAIPNRMAKLHGGFELGVVFAFLFFAAIAAGANVVQLVTNAPMIIAYIAILLSIHAGIAFTLAKFCKLSLPEIIIASNAAILGATTAPALAAAKGWRDLVTPGVLVGVLGYALGTVLGTLVFSILG